MSILTRIAAVAALSLAALAPLALTPPADASSRSGRTAASIPVADAAAFAKQVEQDLAQRGARVAIVFRRGRAQEDLPEGISFTHGAFWVYRTIELADGSFTNGYAVYNLYSGANGDELQSFLKQDWPIDFTGPSAEPEVGIIIPSLGMQKRMYDIIDSPMYETLHQPSYSLISNPHDLRFQNCNEFMMDIIAEASWQTGGDRAQLKANLGAHFEPTPIATNPLQRLFATFVDERLRTEDHRGAIKTATYASMAAFMTKFDLAQESYTLTYAPE